MRTRLYHTALLAAALSLLPMTPARATTNDTVTVAVQNTSQCNLTIRVMQHGSVLKTQRLGSLTETQLTFTVLDSDPVHFVIERHQCSTLDPLTTDRIVPARDLTLRIGTTYYTTQVYPRRTA